MGFTHSGFDNAVARQLLPGHCIVERNEQGTVKKRVMITDVTRYLGHVHVTLKGGQMWCYDSNAPVEME